MMGAISGRGLIPQKLFLSPLTIAMSQTVESPTILHQRLNIEYLYLFIIYIK